MIYFQMPHVLGFIAKDIADKMGSYFINIIDFAYRNKVLLMILYNYFKILLQTNT